MSLSGDAVRQSYAACHRLCRRSGSNFAAAFLLLPRPKRAAMEALYAFMRHTDDLADNPHPELPPARALAEWLAALDAALLGRVEPGAGKGGCGGTRPSPEEIVGRSILPAVADMVERFRVPPEHLRAVIDGCQMDLKKHRYETFDELSGYCHLVASAVGLACIHIWGFEGTEALEMARHCGLALQLTNILRDLKADAEQDRVYLPQEDLRRFDYSTDDLMRGVTDGRFAALMEFEAERAEGFYRLSAPLVDLIAPDGRRVYGMMVGAYHGLLKKIRRHPKQIFAGRVRLGSIQKAILMARWAVLRPSAAALL